MAIAFHATATAVNPGSDTLAYDVGTGDNRYIVVQSLIQSGQTADSFTYGGVAMTQLTTIDTISNEKNYLWGLAAPASGTNDIVGSFSGAGTRVFDASSYTGAQQTTAVEASNTNSGSGTSGTVVITSITDNAWLVGYFRGNGSGAFTAGAETVIRGSAGNGTRQMVDSGIAHTPAAANSLNVTMASQNYWAMAIALKPVEVVSSFTPKITVF